MAVHIAPIGTITAHVNQWIREVPPVTKIYLIHSKKTAEIDFPKMARDLEKKIKEDYPGVETIKRPIENAFNLDDTMDAITKIVYDERETGVGNYDIKINVTGGTNVMAAAAILVATKCGTKAYYVLDPRKNPGQKSYVVELPIPPMGIAKMNEKQQKVLQLISEGTFVLKDVDGKVIDKQGPGVTTNEVILGKMGWDKKVYTDSKGNMHSVNEINDVRPGARIRREGATRLRAIAQNLERKGYITIVKEIPALEKTSFGSGGRPPEYKKVTHSGVMYKITSAGRRQAKDRMMFKE